MSSTRMSLNLFSQNYDVCIVNQVADVLKSLFNTRIIVVIVVHGREQFTSVTSERVSRFCICLICSVSCLDLSCLCLLVFACSPLCSLCLLVFACFRLGVCLLLLAFLPLSRLCLLLFSLCFVCVCLCFPCFCLCLPLLSLVFVFILLSVFALLVFCSPLLSLALLRSPFLFFALRCSPVSNGAGTAQHATHCNTFRNLFSVFDGTENIKKNPLPVHMSAQVS